MAKLFAMSLLSGLLFAAFMAQALNPRGQAPEADFIFAAILPCFVKISAARRGSK